jgi:hypothetical protein
MVATMPTLMPITYPARPRNGGPLDLAIAAGMYPVQMSSAGEPPSVYFQPKYNGWRALIHTPTGTVYNRHGVPMAGEVVRELQGALRKLALLPFGWLDCEILERRHDIGRGSIIVLDWVQPDMCYLTRRAFLEVIFGARDMVFVNAEPCIKSDEVYLTHHYRPEDALLLWSKMQEVNTRLGCVFYEGVVSKLSASHYPIQRHMPDGEFPAWVKHRFTTR